MNKNTLRVIDAFARYYVKTERFQDALNILFETLPEKEKVFGEFSDEFIETESQIGAIYLTEGETLNAAQHLKTVKMFRRTSVFNDVFFSFFSEYFSVSIYKNLFMDRKIRERFRRNEPWMS